LERLFKGNLETSIRAQNNLGQIALHIAALSGSKEVLEKLLVCHPLGIVEIDTAGSTALHLAAANGKAHVVEKLLDAAQDLRLGTN